MSRVSGLAPGCSCERGYGWGHFSDGQVRLGSGSLSGGGGLACVTDGCGVYVELFAGRKRGRGDGHCKITPDKHASVHQCAVKRLRVCSFPTDTKYLIYIFYAHDW